jgi:hypothetical protein
MKAALIRLGIQGSKPELPSITTPLRRADAGAWRQHAVMLLVKTYQVLLSVSGVPDKLVRSSLVAVAM